MRDGRGLWMLVLGKDCVQCAPGGQGSAGPAGRRAAWRKVDLAGLGSGWPAAWGTRRAQRRLVVGMWENV